MVQHHISDYQKRPFQKQVTAESIKKKKSCSLSRMTRLQVLMGILLFSSGTLRE